MALHFDRSQEVTYRVADEVIPGIRRVVAENPGPYTFKGTATFVIGRGEVAIVDPGPADKAHIDAILAALPGERITHQLITHTHPDHSPGARLIKEQTGAPTFGFGPHPVSEEAAQKADEKAAPSEADEEGTDTSSEEKSDVDFVPDTFVADGDSIVGPGWSVEAVHTPGHLANHLCFSLNGEILFSGDHVMGWSTSVISPPGGNLNDYLESLTKLLARNESVYLPTHGSPITDPRDFVRGLIAHRNDRTAQIREQLRSGARTVEELVEALYVGLDTRLIKAAGRSVSAHLESMERDATAYREHRETVAGNRTTHWREAP